MSPPTRIFIFPPSHDVGKIGISERIISKPDRLSREFDI
jgi:HD-GYP domain-containing protein (c-di-GMP phosphodiesterase class II)